MRLGLSLIVGAVLAVAPAAAETARPNIVLVLADDLGYGDLACYGAKDVQTPNLDRFAAEGLRLTSCYAGHANCSPSRTALMTGRTPTRVGVRNWIPQDSPVHLRRSEITIATLLKRAGYATCHVGKWHLNGEFNKPTQPQPGDHGFDHWFSTQNNAVPNHRNPDNFVRNGKPVGKLEGYSAPAGRRRGDPLAQRRARQGEAVLPLRLLPRAARADRLGREVREALSLGRSQLHAPITATSRRWTTPSAG